jgi:hypothetical protein
MTVRCISLGVVNVAIWSGVPSIQDADDVSRAVQDHARRIGRKIVLVGILADGCKMPDEKVRGRMGALWPILIDASSTVQFVNMTKGFVAARMISLLVSVFALGQRGQVQIHQTLLPALQEAGRADPGIDVTALHKRIAAEMATV